MNRELLDFLGKSVAKPAASTSRNEIGAGCLEVTSNQIKISPPEW